jgi:hypothetical protein
LSVFPLSLLFLLFLGPPLFWGERERERVRQCREQELIDLRDPSLSDSAKKNIQKKRQEEREVQVQSLWYEEEREKQKKKKRSMLKRNEGNEGNAVPLIPPNPPPTFSNELSPR